MFAKPVNPDLDLIDHRRLDADLLEAEIRSARNHLGVMATGPRRLR